jgi:thiol-disulfide isomerase/thioredoxin
MRHITIITFLLLISSCSEKSAKYQPNIDVNLILIDFSKWWNYFNSNIDLSSDFIAYDQAYKEIDKAQFLDKLKTGKYIPIKLKTVNPLQDYYQLIINNNNSDIKRSIIAEATTVLFYLNRVGTKFPNYNFIDLEGNSISTNNSLGKYVIFKTWFIHCAACVKEIPELNELVKFYLNRKDIFFVSLAFDDNYKLQEFLKMNPLNYNNVKVSKEFIQDTLHFNIYPTHIVVDRTGKIEKIFNNSDKLISYLKSHIK